MNEFLYKIIPMILSSLICEIIYLKVDKKFKITEKIYSKVPIKQEWKAPFFAFSCIMGVVIIGISGSFIDMNETIYYILCGCILGISYSFTNGQKTAK